LGLHDSKKAVALRVPKPIALSDSRLFIVSNIKAG